MPTASERQALIFLAAVALVGGGVRMAGVRRFERESGAARLLGGGAANAGAAVARQIAAVDSARERTAKRAPARRSSPARQRPTLTSGERTVTRDPVDVNIASATELEALPRVGPALAQRIVEYRTTHGAFGSLEDLRHVRGIGVTTASLLEPLVTFSSGHRPIQSESRRNRRDSVKPLH
ncbi:MAG TPA: helix-hairpin-helix domain-containing protein [Gemmatimonas sp.]|nr:helix-hairpin-helix domain-containing protein [Gemmatimonas sp.]